MSLVLGRAAIWWNRLPPRQKIAIAAKAGAWAEFAGERVYKRVMPFVRRRFKRTPRRLGHTKKAIMYKRRRITHPISQEIVTESMLPETDDMTMGTIYNIPKVYLGKYKDMHTSTTTTLNVGTMKEFKLGENIAKGTDEGDRLGQDIRMKHTYLEAYFSNPNTDLTDTCRIRLICVQNKRVGSLFTANLFEPVAATNSPVDYNAFGKTIQLINKINLNKFNVYYDKVIQCPIAGYGWGHAKDALVKANVTLNKKFTYNDEVSADDKIYPDMQWMFFIESDNNNASLTTPINVTYIVHEYFTDEN